MFKLTSNQQMLPFSESLHSVKLHFLERVHMLLKHEPCQVFGQNVINEFCTLKLSHVRMRDTLSVKQHHPPKRQRQAC